MSDSGMNEARAEYAKDDSKSAATRRTITFAAGLQPLMVEEASSHGVFKASAMLACTPHVAISRKVFTDRCKSKIVLLPASSRPATVATLPSRLSSPPPQVQKRCATAPTPYRPHPFGETVTSVLPEVLQFETWWQAKGQQHSMCVDFHTATQEFHVRGPEDMWLTMNGGSGQQLEHWDLHVGAQLDVAGRRVVLKKASCSTTAWLDGWAKLLLSHKQRLEAQLSKFVPVVGGEGLIHREHQHFKFDQGLQLGAASGGRINLRSLRDDVAFLAWRLRQHKAAVYLPPELQDLRPEGPNVWSTPGDSMSPQLVCQPYTPKAPGHARCSQLLQRSLKRIESAHKLPSLGETPNSLNHLQALNRVNLWEWIQSNPLAASAAVDRRCYAAALEVKTPGGGGATSSKTPGPVTGRRLPQTTRGVKTNMFKELSRKE